MNYSQYLPSGFANKSTRISTDDLTAKGFGDQAQRVCEEFSTASAHFTEPVSRTQLIQKFDRLAATWEYNNAFMSSTDKMVLLPEYQEIIGMGKDAIPLILEELKVKPSYWFWALKAITGENPIQPDDRGNIEKLTEAWLKWGRENNYIS